MQIIGNNLNVIYKELCGRLYIEGKKANNTTELQNVLIMLDNVDKCIITNEAKPASIKYLLAENIWYGAGDNSIEFIGKYAKKWLEISDDGITANSAYGYIMHQKFGFNQIQLCIDMLKKDKNSRRACIIINDANSNAFETLDEPCTMFIQFLIRENKLNCSVTMRSNDIIWGLPYDIPAFITIQKYIANALNIECGIYNHYAISLHCYDYHYHLLREIFNSKYKDNVEIDFLKLYNFSPALHAVLSAKRTNTDVIELCKTFDILKVKK